MASRSKQDNPMRKIEIEKVVVNLSVGEAGDKIQKAFKVLKDLSGQEPVMSKAKITIRSFSVRRGEKIATHVTLRGDKAKDILKRGLAVKEFELKERNFTDHGHFGFGIEEHIDLGLRYDPYTGIFGMDFYVVLKRPGLRVRKRKRNRQKIGTNQKISKEEAQNWFKKECDAMVM